MSSDRIVVRGAREHNLKNIDVEIPRHQLVVITGLSGSGKSSLAFDTVYAEGQRRYVESLSAYARQFLKQNQKPDVDAIEGLSPAIAIEQKSTSKNPRSTVGTLTEIYDYLRLLYARVGIPYCPVTGKPIARQSVQQIVDAILEQPEKTKLVLMAPVVRGRKGEYKKELERWRKEGFSRVRIDSVTHRLDEPISIEKNIKHDIELVVDRLVVRPDIRTRLTDSVELCVGLSDGLLMAEVVGGETLTFSEKFESTESGLSFSELTPRMFSFNSPYGACEACDGLGFALEMDPDKVIPDLSLSLAGGALKPPGIGGYYMQLLRCLCSAYDRSMDTPWKELPKSFRKVILYGSGRKKISFVYEGDNGSYKYERPFEGLMPVLNRRLRETKSDRSREELQSYMSQKLCASCGGARLKPEARAVRVGGKAIHEVTEESIRSAVVFFETLTLDGSRAEIAAEILKEIGSRLNFLNAVGLEYLSLNRGANTLSGGESQRIRLATQIGSALEGVIYVLDEPSIGLHQRDNGRLLETLEALRDLGNTVLVVEHDEETIRRADHILDLGPGAGIHGGSVVAAGSADEIIECEQSITGAYLSGRASIDVPKGRRPVGKRQISVTGATGNNLKGVSVAIPVGLLTCVTGVSGSGKSTLVNQTLLPAVARHLHGSAQRAAAHQEMTGLDHIDKVVAIDQSPIGRTPRSNPATYTQLFGPIRELFAGVPDSRARGYKAGRFSFNVKGGRCEACEGDGLRKIEMHFLPDVYVVCEQCAAKRYNRETLEIRYRDRTIADVLAMTVDEAAQFFSAIPSVSRKLETLQAVGLGYIQLGQSATTLSGGEAQRIKLSRELAKRATGRTLYVLDEPTTGLHFEDVSRLLGVLQTLVDHGNTMVVIEHNLDVIKCADYIVDLGPEGGSGGGSVVATGTPEEVAGIKASHTGKFLKAALAG